MEASLQEPSSLKYFNSNLSFFGVVAYQPRLVSSNVVYDDQNSATISLHVAFLFAIIYSRPRSISNSRKEFNDEKKNPPGQARQMLRTVPWGISRWRGTAADFLVWRLM